jgi:methionyl aminopeptidase
MAGRADELRNGASERNGADGGTVADLPSGAAGVRPPLRPTARMIFLKSWEEIEIMRAANVIVAEVLAELRSRVRPGVTTGDLDRVAEEMTRQRGATSAFKGYEVGGRTFPSSVCVSINDEVVHGIPSNHRVCYKGYYGDAAMTVPVADVDAEAQELMTTAEEALWAAIENVRPGNRMGEVSAAVQEHVEGRGFSVVREFVGHGIGRRLHEDPQVPNFGKRGSGVRLRPGMVLAIEPMVNAGTPGR